MPVGVQPRLARSALLAASVLVMSLCGAALLTQHRSRESHAPLSSETQAIPVAVKSSSTQARELRLGRPLNLNLATPEDLRLLPGIGPKLAERIVHARSQLGRFGSLADLDAVPGIGAKKLAALAPLVRFDTEVRAETATRATK